MLHVRTTSARNSARAGGIALTYWALRKAGMERRQAAARMVAFLVLLYAVYAAALIAFGILLRTGILNGDDPVGGTIVPADMFDEVVRLLRDYRATPAASPKGASGK